MKLMTDGCVDVEISLNHFSGLACQCSAVDSAVECSSGGVHDPLHVRSEEALYYTMKTAFELFINKCILERTVWAFSSEAAAADLFISRVSLSNWAIDLPFGPLFPCYFHDDILMEKARGSDELLTILERNTEDRVACTFLSFVRP